ncbi:MAG: hypothetical protein ACJA2S_002168 [Cyclobacteriaceae bacterium]|jgi:hypothetical protein
MPKYQTGEEYFNKIYLVFNAIIALSLVPFVLIFLDIQQYGTDEKIITGQSSDFLIIGLSIAYIFVFYVSLTSFKKGISGIKRSNPIRGKLNEYYSLSLKKYFQLTICCFLMVLGLFLTKHFLFTIGYVLALVVLSFGRPLLKTIVDIIALNDTEKDILNNKKSIDP